MSWGVCKKPLRSTCCPKDAVLDAQGYLKALEDRTVVVVSHDRSFLDAVAKEIILFRHKTLAYHAGNYSGKALPYTLACAWISARKAAQLCFAGVRFRFAYACPSSF